MKDIKIPAEWWGTLSEDETVEIFRSSTVAGEPLKRLWKMLGRKDRMPKAFDLMVEKKSLDRLLNQMKSPSKN